MVVHDVQVWRSAHCEAGTAAAKCTLGSVLTGVKGTHRVVACFVRFTSTRVGKRGSKEDTPTSSQRAVSNDV